MKELVEAGDEPDDNEDDDGPVGAADGSSGRKASLWAEEDEDTDVPDELLGTLTAEAEREGRLAAKNVGQDSSGPPGKRVRT